MKKFYLLILLLLSLTLGLIKPVFPVGSGKEGDVVVPVVKIFFDSDRKFTFLIPQDNGELKLETIFHEYSCKESGPVIIRDVKPDSSPSMFFRGWRKGEKITCVKEIHLPEKFSFSVESNLLSAHNAELSCVFETWNEWRAKLGLDKCEVLEKLSSGDKIIIYVDEIFMITPSEFEILVPYGEGKYRLHFVYSRKCSDVKIVKDDHTFIVLEVHKVWPDKWVEIAEIHLKNLDELKGGIGYKLKGKVGRYHRPLRSLEIN
jgi:hypothetical protein